LENNIREKGPFCRSLLCHSSVEHTSSLLQKRSCYETWLPNITEIAPVTLLAGSGPNETDICIAIYKHAMSFTLDIHFKIVCISFGRFYASRTLSW